jgi:uncharacterized protein
VNAVGSDRLTTDTALGEAAGVGNLTAVQALIGAGANVNAPDKEGFTPLHGAAVNGSLEVVRTSLDAGADANRVDSNGKTPLAVAWGHPDVENLIRQRGGHA